MHLTAYEISDCRMANANEKLFTSFGDTQRMRITGNQYLSIFPLLKSTSFYRHTLWCAMQGNHFYSVCSPIPKCSKLYYIKRIFLHLKLFVFRRRMLSSEQVRSTAIAPIDKQTRKACIVTWSWRDVRLRSMQIAVCSSIPLVGSNSHLLETWKRCYLLHTSEVTFILFLWSVSV